MNETENEKNNKNEFHQFINPSKWPINKSLFISRENYQISF